MNIIIAHGFEANFSVGFAKGLAANGVEICVVSCDETASRLTAAGISNINLRGNLDSHRPFGSKFINLVRYYLRLLLFLFRQRGATIHFTGIFRNELILWEGLVLNLYFRLLSARYIYTVHNVLPHSRKNSRFFRLIYRFIYKIPHLLFVHTRSAQQQLNQEFGVANNRLHMTSIGLNEEMPISSLSSAEARSRLGYGEKEKIILFFGKIDEYKGLDVLLDAFEKISNPETRLVIAGTFRNRTYRPAIYSKINQMLRKQDVRIDERFVPNNEVEIFFKGCDVLCLPYRHIYQSGLVFLGPCFGIPMVTTNAGSLSEFVNSGLGLVTDTNDAAGLTEALNKFFNSQKLFPRDAILLQAKKYTWISVCRDLVPFYSKSPSSSVLEPLSAAQ